jgi:hypothetical protein
VKVVEIILIASKEKVDGTNKIVSEEKLLKLFWLVLLKKS